MHARARGTAGGSGRACRGSPRRRSPRHVRGIVRLAATSFVRSQLLPQACVPARGRPRRGLTAAASPPVLLAAGLVPFSFPPAGPARGNLSLDSPALDGTNRPHSTTQPAARARQARACMRGRTVAWRVACCGRAPLSDASSIFFVFWLIEIQGNVGWADRFFLKSRSGLIPP